MVLTEAFAAGGAGDRLRHPRLPRRRARRRRRAARRRPATRSRWRRRCARLALDEPRRARMARGGPRARRALRVAARGGGGGRLLRAGARASAHPPARLSAAAVRYGLAPADLQPRIPAERLPSLQPARAPARRPPGRGAARAAPWRGGAVVSRRRSRWRCWRSRTSASTAWLASLLASKPGLVAAGLGLMCAAMFARAIAWHAILVAAPTWRRAKRRDAMQGTFIGVLMSATLPARLGEPSRALIVARRLGRARETLPVVLGTMVSQTLLNLLALALLGAGDAVERRLRSTAATGRCSPPARAAGGAVRRVLLAPVLLPERRRLRAQRAQALAGRCAARLARLRDGLRVFAPPAPGGARHRALQLGAWALQLAELLAPADGARAARRAPASPAPRPCCSPST